MNIKYLLELLRSNAMDGPKMYWKSDAHYFHKIDNYLSVLVCSPIIRRIYQKCSPAFLYEEVPQIDDDFDDSPDEKVENKSAVALIPAAHATSIRAKTTINAFHSIQARLQNNSKCFVSSALSPVTPAKKYAKDALDTYTDACCDNACCVHLNCSADFMECVHNLDRIYLKVMCLIISSMMIGVLFVIIYYSHHGEVQANDAMFLSLEAIGDRLTGKMADEFWVPQMINSLTIGGLTTGDLLPNASLYTFPNYKYDQFFASFTTISHTTAVFSIFMYNYDLNSMIGAYKVPDSADFANGSTVIVDYDGNCRRDRLYDNDLRMRIMFEPFTVTNADLPHYSDCDYDPRSRKWYAAAHKIGIGRSQWTEPYVFSEQHQGMSYVTPIIWKGTHLIFVVEVTTYTLAVAVSHEIAHSHLPAGSLWMIVTPGFNAVASSVNETWIDSENCTAECYSDNDMIDTGIQWMKADNISGEQHVSAYSISQSYDISLHSFPLNHVNVHSYPSGADSNELMIKALQLNSAYDYTYGYAVIINDQQYMSDVRTAEAASWVISILAVAAVLILIVCNIRYNNIEQRQLGRQGRSSVIRATTTRRLRVASSKIHSFSQQTSKSHSISGNDSTVVLPLDQTLNSLRVSHKSGRNQSNSHILAIGDRIKTKDNKYGIVKFVGKLNGVHDGTHNMYVLLKLEQNKGTILVPLTHVIMNFGNKAQIESADTDKEATNMHIASGSTIDDKILNATLAPIRKVGESDDDDTNDDESEEEEDIEDVISDDEQAGNQSLLSVYSATAKTTNNLYKLQSKPDTNGMNQILSVIEDVEDEKEPPDADVACCGCIKETQMQVIEERTKHFCYFPQKTLLYITYLCLCATLLLVVCIWEILTTDATQTLFEDVMAKHEWSHVQDLVYSMFASTEMITDVVADRFYRNDMNLSNSHEMDRFFLNLMQSFVDVGPSYMQWYIYIATPNGHMRGVRYNNSDNVSTLSAGIRDESTNGSYNVYLMNDITGYHMKNVITDTLNDLYDPRCRGWYRDTLHYAFEGTLEEAFPDDTYIKWKANNNAAAYNVTNCLENRAVYESMWNISNISEPHLWEHNLWKYEGEKHKMVWSRYLFATINQPQIGLTASRPIIDLVTGELLGIIAVDYTLQVLSEYIAQTVNNPFDDGHSQISYDRWHSWIFESTQGDFEMIASSDGKVLRDAKETEGCYGFLVTVDNQKVPYSADEHPKALIRVYSKEVIYVHGINTLGINSTQSENIRVPAGLPQLEGGRIQYYPGGNHSIDWIVLKTTDVTDSSVDDFSITIIAILLIMSCVWVLLKELDYMENKMELSGLLKKRKKKEESMYNIERDDLDRSDYLAIMCKMRPIVDGAANSKWSRLINELQESSNNVLTTEQAKTFLANRANEHIASENENNDVFRECAWNACNYQKLSKRFELHFWEFIESNYYDVPVQILLLAHLIVTFWEPSTPQQLRENGLDWNLVVVLAAFQIIQWFDCVLVGIKRFFEFKIKEPFLTSLYELNYGFNHKFTQQVKLSRDRFNNKRNLRAMYLTFRGPHCKRYLVHIVFAVIDFINFILQITFRVAPFSYYIPILPFLIIIRNHHVLLFGSDFISALIYAKDVLFSYFCFILIFAILSMSLFSDRVNNSKFADSFQSIHSAFITGFAFISTSENYAIMYDVFESDYYSDSHWIVLGNVVLVTIFFALCGMFCWIPMIIDKFEQAFEESNMRHDEKNKLRKTNAIIASFVMLDFNSDLDIDHTEFECLITCSVLIEKNKLFSAFDENNSNTLDIYEFVQCLLKQSFRTKIISSSSTTIDSKFTAFCECNIFRHREYKLYIFVFLVIPVIGLSVIKGLTHRFNENSINLLIGILFIVNMTEIHLRCFCFGCDRFWDLLKYPNPNYVIAAIDKYRSSQTELMSSSKYKQQQDAQSTTTTIRLTSYERNWVTNNLKEVRPLSILEKSTQTLCNRIELISFWFCFALYFLMQLLFEIHQSSDYVELNDRYCLYFIQAAVMMRIFTLIPSNQQLLYIIFQVFPDFIALFAFLGLYIYSWARIGCTLFGDNKTDIVLPEIYEPAEDMVANFDSLSYAILALIQLMIGEGWHEVMYFNTIGTTQLHSVYFIIYITVCSLIIANVFVGLFLADIDEFTQQQSHDEIIKHSTKKSKSFQIYAKQKLNKLFYQIQQNLHQNKLMNEQIQHINFILYQQQLQQQQTLRDRQRQNASVRHQSSSSMVRINK